MKHHRVILGTFLMLVACGGDTAPPTPISVTFVNHLRYPMTITAVGATPSIVTGTSTLAFPGGTTTVTWTEKKETYGDGSEIPDDLNATSLLVANLATFTISNVIGTTTYFEPYLTNSSGQTIAIAIAHGATVRCLGSQTTGGGGARWGYYVLDASTEWRYYKPGTACTGSYRYWGATTIGGAMFGSGTVLLEATTPP